MKLDINEKIDGILQSNKIDELPLKYLPPVADNPDNYYFISYSHLDYKYVYPDIFAMQAEGLNIWYDRAMPAGESWKETAEKYIRPSRCAGVVFYVSENSLLSPAIHQEIDFAKKCGKSCLTINIPSEGGASRSAKEMLDKLIADGKNIDADKYNFISKTFNDEVLYIPYSSSAEVKVEKILKLKKPPLFEFEEVQFYGIKLVAVKDNEIRKISKSDLYYTDETTGETLEVDAIGRCAFANCLNLEYVELPSSVSSIEEYAFCGCRSLKTINLDNVHFISSNAFSGCEALCDVNLSADSPLSSIGEEAFAECYSLENIIIPNSLKEIANRAFADCGLRKIIIPECVKELGISAFNNCQSLEEVVIGDGITSIKEDTFVDCCAMKSIELGASVQTIEEAAFAGCSRSLLNIKVSPRNEYFSDEGNCLIGANGMIVLGCASSVIPNRKFISTIGSWAFANCDGLKEIIIPDCIASINKYAFSRCSNLRKVYVGKRVARIKDYAFDKCDALKEIHISDISSWCNIEFDYDGNPLSYAHNLYLNGALLTDLKLPDTPIKVKAFVFADCHSLKTVNLNQAISVEILAFQNCISLTEVVVPYFTIIQSTSFSRCDNLQYQVYDNAKYLGDADNPYRVLVGAENDDIASCLIHPQTGVIAGYAFAGCHAIKELKIPQGVRFIGSSAFYSCEQLVAELPESIQYIGDGAFSYCHNQSIINLSANVAYIGENAFEQSVVVINYAGTTDQWAKIVLGGKNWYATADWLLQIRCLDCAITRRT